MNICSMAYVITIRTANIGFKIFHWNFIRLFTNESIFSRFPPIWKSEGSMCVHSHVLSVIVEELKYLSLHLISFDSSRRLQNWMTARGEEKWLNNLSHEEKERKNILKIKNAILRPFLPRNLRFFSFFFSLVIFLGFFF